MLVLEDARTSKLLCNTTKTTLSIISLSSNIVESITRWNVSTFQKVKIIHFRVFDSNKKKQQIRLKGLPCKVFTNFNQ